jgi:hypothetical protein
MPLPPPTIPLLSVTFVNAFSQLPGRMSRFVRIARKFMIQPFLSDFHRAISHRTRARHRKPILEVPAECLLSR